MSLFEDLNLDDFSSSLPNTNSYKPTYLHTFKPEKFGFKALDEDNIKFFRNINGEIRYYLRKKYVSGSSVDIWLFKVINKNNQLLHHEEIVDLEIKNRIPIFLRRDVLKDFLEDE